MYDDGRLWFYTRKVNDTPELGPGPDAPIDPTSLVSRGSFAHEPQDEPPFDPYRGWL